ncbi:hypothetical protein J6590_006182 [Homalodisca vitripennis]|nr:hypothetical protein J6590_006182 [Homalodisca vitripennis]
MVPTSGTLQFLIGIRNVSSNTKSQYCNRGKAVKWWVQCNVCCQYRSYRAEVTVLELGRAMTSARPRRCGCVTMARSRATALGACLSTHIVTGEIGIVLGTLHIPPYPPPSLTSLCSLLFILLLVLALPCRGDSTRARAGDDLTATSPQLRATALGAYLSAHIVTGEILGTLHVPRHRHLSLTFSPPPLRWN